MDNILSVGPNTKEENLIFEGIIDFLFLFEKIFNGNDVENLEVSYQNHKCRYNEFKTQAYCIENVRYLMKDGFVIPFKLEVSRIQLTAVIQIIAEIIAGRDFSCEFDKYTIIDIRALQDALGKLWLVSDCNGQKAEIIHFR